MLSKLINKPFNCISRAVDMLCLFLGDDYDITSTDGRTVKVAEFSLHLQTQWRFRKDNTILLASRDIYEPYSKDVAEDWEYDIIGTWYKCNMTDVMGGIGLAQLERYPAMLQRRKEIIERYDVAFKPLGVQVLNHYTDDHVSCGHLYITRVPNITIEQRNAIIIKMAEAGVACNVHYKPLPMHTAYKNLGFDIKDYPNAYNLFANEITLPLHTRLTDEEVDYVIENFTKIIESVR